VRPRRSDEQRPSHLRASRRRLRGLVVIPAAAAVALGLKLNVSYRSTAGLRMGLYRSGGEAVLFSDSSFRRLLNIVTDQVHLAPQQHRSVA
jgi:hypothetical protein